MLSAGFPGGSVGEESACNAGDLVSIPGEGNGNPPQYSCLENPMDRRAWWAPVRGVAKVRCNLEIKPPPPPRAVCNLTCLILLHSSIPMAQVGWASYLFLAFFALLVSTPWNQVFLLLPKTVLPEPRRVLPHSRSSVEMCCIDEQVK